MKVSLLLIFIVLYVNLFGQNQNISSGFVFDGEPYLAVNPNNSNHLVVAWMGYKYLNFLVIKTKVSFDGGQTWSNSNYAPHTNPVYGSADPSIDFDANGNVFLCYIDFSPLIDSGSVYIRKSIDGGLTWGLPIEVINSWDDPGKYPVDRPWITIDRTGGNYNGYIYITTMNPNVFGYVPPPYNPYFLRSVDEGNSFEPWKFLDTIGWLAGNLIKNPFATNAVSINGTFHAAYPSWVFSQYPYPQYILASSIDGGNSFSYKSIMNLSGHIAITDTMAKKAYLFLSDPSDPEHMAFFWLLNDYGDPDVFMWESYDTGITWSNPVRINDDPIGNKRIQDLVWADFDSDGDLIVTWRDRRNAPDTTYTTSSEIWGAFRSKDSLNFSPNFQISDVSAAYDTILASAGNDFMCVQLMNDTLHAVWGDMSNGFLNIWYCKKKSDGTIVSIVQISHEKSDNILLYPNPTTGITEIKNIGDIKDYEIFVYDNTGLLVYQTKNKITVDISLFPAGTYYIKLKTINRLLYSKIIRIE